MNKKSASETITPGTKPVTKMDVVKALAPIVIINVAAIAALVIFNSKAFKGND